MSKQKFQVGDIVRLNKKSIHKYNQIKTDGAVIATATIYEGREKRKMYEVKFPDKAFTKWFYSWELDFVSGIRYGKYLPTKNVKLINGHTEEEIRSWNPTYHDFMDKYHKEHAVCPKCGSRHLSSTLVGYLYNSKYPERYKDCNRTLCMDCGWSGIRHDLVPEKEK